MPYFLPVTPDLAWPFALALAWIVGEFAHRLIRAPRISSYGIAGFLLAAGQSGFLPPSNDGAIMLLANIAFGLILFELGYRINLRWLRNNPWLGVTSLVEASATFAAVYFVAQWFDMAFIPSLLLSSLAIAAGGSGSGPRQGRFDGQHNYPVALTAGIASPQLIQHRLALFRPRQNPHQHFAVRQLEIPVFEYFVLLEQFADIRAVLLRQHHLDQAQRHRGITLSTPGAELVACEFVAPLRT